MLDLAIVGATAVLPGATRHADVGISGGKIAIVASPGQLEPATKTIDAGGMLLLPGAVDAHTHLDAEMFGATTADDFASGTIAAAAGGVTTIIDYAFQASGGSLGAAISKWEEKARGRAIVDYGFHVAILDPSPSAIAEIPKVVERGVTSFKIFMMRGFEERARDFMRAFRAAADAGALLTIHAEDEHLIGYCTERLLAAGNRGVAHFASSRPPLSEAAAVLHALKMTETTDAPVYFVHLSSKAAIDEIRRARASGTGRAVLAETRPIYLYLTQERFLEPQGEKYVGYPPLRERADLEAIWEALADGTVDVVATDHCSWPLQRKTEPDRFTRIPPGMSNLETLVPMLYSEGVVKRRITLEKMVDLISSNPAKIFGLYPRKGAIATGSDADLVVFDPNAKVVVRAAEMHSRADYDPFEGFEVTGWPRMTISRGEIIVDGRTPTAVVGRGKFLPRTRFSPQLAERLIAKGRRSDA
ncbi:MAG TPA: dihydropyrimidinase [Candidatus Binataceae bacterium]|nr:dihydropyrimidinase [Candidatus Binataceae bacterium]